MRRQEMVVARGVGALSAVVLVSLFLVAKGPTKPVELEQSVKVDQALLARGMRVLARIHAMENQKSLARHAQRSAQQSRQIAQQAVTINPEFESRSLEHISQPTVSQRLMHKQLGMRRIEGRGGLDGLGDKEVSMGGAKVASKLKISASSKLKSAAAWTVYVDKKNGRPFYFNSATGQSTWRFPKGLKLYLKGRKELGVPKEGYEEKVDKFDTARNGNETSFPHQKDLYDPKTKVLVSRWPIDVDRMIPFPSFDANARVQNQRNAQRALYGPNMATAGTGAKLQAEGLNVDGDLDFPELRKDHNETDTLKENGVKLSGWPFDVYKSVPSLAWDKNEWDAEKEEPRAREDPMNVKDEAQKLKAAGVRVYNLPPIPPWSTEKEAKYEGKSREYVDGLYDQLTTLKDPKQEYGPVRSSSSTNNRGWGLRSTAQRHRSRDRT